MKDKYKIISIVSVLIVFAWISQPVSTEARAAWNRGMGGGTAMMNTESITVPETLPAPKNSLWVNRLETVLGKEKQALAQYELDQAMFNANMPYRMIIPTKEYHIQWIDELFKAYNLTPEEATFDTKQPQSLTQAYETGMRLEEDLIPEYEWLVKNAEDRDSGYILNTILLHTRWQEVRFEHALALGENYNTGMGGRMTNRGQAMMNRGSAGRSPEMGGQGAMNFQSRQDEPVDDIAEARSMANEYLKSIGNPDLKLGVVKDDGNEYKADILTKENDELVTRIIINKQTGRMRSSY